MFGNSDDRGTMTNAVLGAVATVLLSFLLVSPLVGGALAGYLENGSGRDGTVAGALSGGVVAAVASLLLVGLSLLVPVQSGIAPLGVSPGPLVVLLVAILVVGGYLVALSAVGGYVGFLVREMTAD